MNKKNNIKRLVQAALFLAIAIVFQLIQKNFTQIVPTLIGPLINAILLLTSFVCGVGFGILIAILIPLFAVITGALFTPLIPFVPFIIIADILTAAVFGIISHKGKYGIYIGGVLAALVNYGWFFLASTKLIYIFKLALKPQIIHKIGIVFGIPQLINSIIGAVIAIVIINILRKRKISNY